MRRREFLTRSGAIVVSFALARAAGQEGGGDAGGKPGLPGSLGKAPQLDAWIRVGADGSVTVFTGKAELGLPVATGVFGARMEVEIVNDGPVTVVLELS